MKKFFRLYSDNKTEYNSSVFDLISGEKETKQTKGLAYILSQNEGFLYSFLQLKLLAYEIEKRDIVIAKKHITSIEVSAERLTTDKKRADIIIKIDSQNKPLIAIIIEAKSIKVRANQQELSKQISGYLEEDQFTGLNGYKKIGVALTRYSQNIPNVVSVTWENIIQLLHEFCKKTDNDGIIKQYLNFITEIEKSMKYYEKEVLSIPAGRSLELVEKFNIYVCPDTKAYSYKKPIFVGFRKSGGGVMERLYKIDSIIVLNPTIDSEIETFKRSEYSENIKTRILNYIEAAEFTDIIDYDERFYILSENEYIELVNRPKPQRNNAKFTYYTLSEVLSKKIISPESAYNSNILK